jgi:hypothetical protein
MAKYRLYAGLGGSMGGLVYQGTEEFKSHQEAEWRAYDIAWEEYESYGGNHGLLDWDACYEDALESEWIDPHSQTQEEIERIVDDHYREQVESWIVYKAVLVTGPGVDPDCDDDYYYNDDDADCYTDD